jgi:DNA polymerase-1
MTNLFLKRRRPSADEAVAHITRIMEAAASPVVDLTVPLVAEAGIADSWADAH